MRDPGGHDGRERELLERIRGAEAPYRLEAWREPSEVVSAAVAIADAGLGGPALIDLAGDDRAPREEVLRDLDRALHELGLEPLATADALRREAARLGRRFLDGELDAPSLAARIWVLWGLAGMPQDALADLDLATHMFLDEPEYTSEAEYREAVESFVSTWGEGQTML